MNTITAENINEHNGHGITALFVAVRNMDVGKVKKYLDLGADPNINNGKSLLEDLATNFASKDKVKIAELLIQKNIDINFRNNYRQTPLYWAVQRQELGLVELLLKNHADPNIPGGCKLETPLDVITKKKETATQKKIKALLEEHGAKLIQDLELPAEDADNIETIESSKKMKI